MSESMQLSLRAGERIYINGAVVRVNRKVTIELLNEVAFLLEAHVLQADEATTPLRQLYFVAQTILVDPLNAERNRAVFRDLHASTLASFSNEAIVASLATVAEHVAAGHTFEALKAIRALFATEAEILSRTDAPSPKATEAAVGASP